VFRGWLVVGSIVERSTRRPAAGRLVIIMLYYYYYVIIIITIIVILWTSKHAPGGRWLINAKRARTFLYTHHRHVWYFYHFLIHFYHVHNFIFLSLNRSCQEFICCYKPYRIPFISFETFLLFLHYGRHCTYYVLYYCIM